jgi:DNA-binding CsgD family transcriptional regulator
MERLGGLALDSVAFGVLVLDAGTGVLLNLNGPAERLCQRGVVHSAGGRMRVGSHELGAPLGSAVPRAMALGPHLRVVVYPAASCGEGRACVVHVHHGPSLARERASRALQLFGLTTREAEVAQALLLGWSTKQIASRHGVALSTLRTQVRALLAKTGSERLATLHALLSGL